MLTQINSIQAALDKVALGCSTTTPATASGGADGTEQEDKTDELMAAIGRLMRRG